MARTKEYLIGTDWDKLNDRQQCFINHYIKDWNATEAARAAGYSNPNSQASKILNHPKVKRWIGNFKRKISEKSEIDVVQLLTKINQGLHRDPAEMCDENGLISNDINSIPLHLRQQIDSIQQEYSELQHPETGEVVGRKVKTKIGLIPGAKIMEMAIDVSGIADNSSSGDLVEIDWEAMTEKSEDDFDLVEVKIKEAMVPAQIKNITKSPPKKKAKKNSPKRKKKT